jgi:hypothetical protein
MHIYDGKFDAFFFNMQKNHKVGWSYSTTNIAEKKKSTNLSLKQRQQKTII